MKIIKDLRVKFYFFRKNIEKSILRKKLIKYYQKNQNKITDTQLLEALKYYESHPITVFPYNLNVNNNFTIFNDSDGFKYVTHDGKKLFFKKNWSEQNIRSYYSLLLQEQEIKSPHRYETDEFKVEKDDIVIDVGCAEGNFSLSVIDRCKKVVLFEYDKGWDMPLSLTFSPYIDKVTIINKKVGSKLNETEVSLDDLDYLKNSPLFIKIDVDGHELAVLDGMKQLLSTNSKIKLVICTYHKHNDANDFNSFFQDLGYKSEFSNGYMLFYYDKNLAPPYLRKGVLRNWK